MKNERKEIEEILKNETEEQLINEAIEDLDPEYQLYINTL